MPDGPRRGGPPPELVRAAWRLGRGLPRVAAGVAVEAGYTAAHLALYPWGLRRAPVPAAAAGGLADLSPAQRGLASRDVEAAGTPILLVHGIGDNHTIFALLQRQLRRRGFRTVSTHDYGLLTRDVRAAARQLGEAVEALCASTGHERLHVVGHSLGGLIARYHVQRQGGDARVDTLVTLGTPHGGTVLARALPGLPLLRQLAPGSDVIAELAEPAPGCRTRFLAVRTDLDHLVVPGRNAALEHPDLDVRNLAVRGVGHLSLTGDARVAREIAATLAELTGGERGRAPTTGADPREKRT
ncbi:esterase/lipase family protein [Microlunatus capsulatus]|uniref:Pimeloyl-ACP methyl ester carboxylesterase n=1 Tax=Microlunatus capsulatus TaxID=99117 RepID=A0ABS4Z5Z1_9ACTN|nr:alpha/beta fold hydrolase [Microlunatus capsulatus]MBP2416462.1 pimeloyl-ACP methyl ester carboxylesterase [Microlunatus capsulatus]